MERLVFEKRWDIHSPATRLSELNLADVQAEILESAECFVEGTLGMGFVEGTDSFILVACDGPNKGYQFGAATDDSIMSILLGMRYAARFQSERFGAMLEGDQK